MKSRFTFSLLLALDFDIYLIDEGMPRTMDAEFNRKAGEILAERLSSTTIVIVSHQADTLEKYASRAAASLASATMTRAKRPWMLGISS